MFFLNAGETMPAWQKINFKTVLVASLGEDSKYEKQSKNETNW
jgi:hypothetical protein